MRYSVWNPAARAFDYYESAAVPLTTNAPKPDHLRSRTLGSTVEQAAWPLPSDAVKVGAGDVAMGRIAVTPAARRAALGAADGASGLVKAVALLGAGALAVHFLTKRT